jgi:hypothetical protein
MGSRLLVLAFLGTTAAAAAAPALLAQSLADVARKEGERRKEVKEPPKIFTNDDLPGRGPASSASSPAAPAASDAKDKPAADAKDGKAADAKTDAKSDDKAVPVKDQKFWSDGHKALVDKLERDKLLADAMQTRVSALSTDFVNRDDPAQRNVIAQDRQKALDELAALKKGIADDTKAVADFEEDARKAGVPAGWLR